MIEFACQFSHFGRRSNHDLGDGGLDTKRRMSQMGISGSLGRVLGGDGTLTSFSRDDDLGSLVSETSCSCVRGGAKGISGNGVVFMGKSWSGWLYERYVPLEGPAQLWGETLPCETDKAGSAGVAT